MKMNEFEKVVNNYVRGLQIICSQHKDVFWAHCYHEDTVITTLGGYPWAGRPGDERSPAATLLLITYDGSEFHWNVQLGYTDPKDRVNYHTLAAALQQLGNELKEKAKKIQHLLGHIEY